MLEQIIWPIDRDEFLHEYWTKKFLHVAGSAGKFLPFYSWEVLNKSLEQTRFDSKRLVLMKSGQKLDGARYLSGHSVHSGRLVNELSNGATLVLNGCEELHLPLRDLCVHLERLFHTRVLVNLYAAWRSDNGFNVHWDNHDVFVLQVSGRKHWRVWQPTRPYPFEDDAPDIAAAPPKGEPVWDGILEPGGMLNIPRGWWHVAFPLDEPCLHLTVTIRNLNGIDMLHWLADQMKSSEAARMELPLIADIQDRTKWLSAVISDLNAACDDTLISRYLADVDSKAMPRPQLSLPAEADRRQSRLGQSARLQLAGPHPLHFSFSGGRAFWQGNGTRCQMDQDVAEVLKAFNDGQPHVIGELAPGRDFRLSGVLGMMLMTGVLRRVPD